MEYIIWHRSACAPTWKQLHGWKVKELEEAAEEGDKAHLAGYVTLEVLA